MSYICLIELRTHRFIKAELYVYACMFIFSAETMMHPFIFLFLHMNEVQSRTLWYASQVRSRLTVRVLVWTHM